MVINHLLTGVILQVKYSQSQNGDDFCPPILMGLSDTPSPTYSAILDHEIKVETAYFPY